MSTWPIRLAKSKTIVVNVLTIAAVVLAGDDIRHFLSDAAVIKVLAAINIALRFVTFESLSAKA